MMTYGYSQYTELGDEDIYRLTAELAEAIAGRAVYITSTNWWPPRLCRKFLQHADKVGADSVKVQLNPWMIMNAGDTKSELFREYYDQILGSSGIPLTLWCNSFGQSPVSIDTIVELASRPDVVAVKNDDHPFYYYYDLIRATRDFDFAVISGGQMRNFAFGYQVGSPAYLTGVGGFRPDVAMGINDLLVAGRYEDAWQWVYEYEEPLFEFWGSMDPMCCIHSILELYGLYPNNFAGPMKKPHTAEEREQVRQGIEKIFGPIERVAL